ncbi:hypothetical protein [Moorena sp. SIO3A5]|nr:hypothetical protein [Moorena sp. SIO3A5]
MFLRNIAFCPGALGEGHPGITFTQSSIAQHLDAMFLRNRLAYGLSFRAYAMARRACQRRLAQRATLRDEAFAKRGQRPQLPRLCDRKQLSTFNLPYGKAKDEQRSTFNLGQKATRARSTVNFQHSTFNLQPIPTAA